MIRSHVAIRILVCAAALGSALPASAGPARKSRVPPPYEVYLALSGAT